MKFWYVIFSLEVAKEAALHHYSKSFRGFSAMLTPEQAKRVAGVVLQNCNMLILINQITLKCETKS